MSILPSRQSIHNCTIQLIQNRLWKEAHDRTRNVVTTCSNIGLDQTQHLLEFFERQFFRFFTELLSTTQPGLPQSTCRFMTLDIDTTEFPSKVLMYQITPTTLIFHQQSFRISETSWQTLVHTFPTKRTQRFQLPFTDNFPSQFIHQTFLSSNHVKN